MSGHMFLVLHPRGGGSPLCATYAVYDPDQSTAENILAIGLADPEAEITYGGALETETLERLGLGSREYRSFWPTIELTQR
jgi:hypothetical protein